jgi:K+-sensing histidine kinase KdpD
MEWTDRIRQVKFLLVLAAMFIVVGSLVFTHYLTQDLKREEHGRMEVWAEAMRSLSQADENTNLSLVLKVINENNTIPVVVMDAQGRAQTFRNLDIHADNYADSLRQATLLGRKLLAEGQYIKIMLDSDSSSEYIHVCYDDSLMLKRLSYYPWVQLGVLLVFIAVMVFALLAAKRSEQNRVWVGLSKETAHQLGTPISSLIAWVEMLKEMYPNDELIPEMDKDVKRLQLIADRFSKIGSVPEPVPSSLTEVLDHVADYMDRRTSKRIRIVKDYPDHDVIVNLNTSLFEWVIENLSKNAVDAMGGIEGTITLHLEDTPQKAIVEVSDTGKGIKKKDIGNVFKPGFTTKKRGWGLGLSLAKRIVEEYHHGKIFVKNSELGKGTTFRIELNKA